MGSLSRFRDWVEKNVTNIVFVTHKRNFQPSKYQADEMLLAVQGSQTQSAREGGREAAGKPGNSSYSAT